MRTEHVLAILSCIRIKGEVNRIKLLPSQVVILYRSFFFVCTSVVSYVAFLLSLFVHHISFFWCLGRTVLRDCGISWVYLLKRLVRHQKSKRKVQGVPQSQAAAVPRHQEEEETDKKGKWKVQGIKQTSANRTNAQRLALSSPSAVITMLKGLKNTRTKLHKARLKKSPRRINRKKKKQKKKQRVRLIPP